MKRLSFDQKVFEPLTRQQKHKCFETYIVYEKISHPGRIF